METATFAAGCFWGVEETFRKIKGVVKTAVGYTGGTMPNPTYEKVCTDKTGHAEAIEITFDPSKVHYSELLKIFWESHNPTTPDRQGPDAGTQYRSGIFYHTSEQKKEAEKSRSEEQKKLKEKIVTEIMQATQFYPAEEYHQKYLHKRGLGTCNI